MYNARVKAFNSTGEGEYSEVIGLQTAEGNLTHLDVDFQSKISQFRSVAWFTFDPELSNGAGTGLNFSNNNSTVAVEGWEQRVALGSVGFSRGIHYWEFTVDKYTADTDPAFGVARIDVARDKMLGKHPKWLRAKKVKSFISDISLQEKTIRASPCTLIDSVPGFSTTQCMNVESRGASQLAVQWVFY